MRFFTLLALVGFASAVRLGGGELKWQPDHEYVYSYRGRMLTGLPELADRHFSGMGIHAKIHLYVKSQTHIVLRISEAEYTRFNQELEARTASQDGHNWRWLNLPGYTPVPSETMRLLAQPTVFEVSEESGRVRSVTVSREEPEWSVNFKKALIVLFQTQTGESSGIRTNSLSGMSDSESTPYINYWTTMEQSVDGECETRYELNELPKSRIYDEEIISGLKKESAKHGNSNLPSVCPSDSKIYEILKVKNVNKCVSRSTFSFYKPGGYECHPDSPSSKTGNCEGMFSRSSVTKYIVCGRSESSYVILSIDNEGELNQDLLGFKSEKMLTGTRQVLKLIEKASSGSGRFGGSSRSGPSDPVTLDTLFYEYSLKKDKQTLKHELGSHKSILKNTFPVLEAGISSGKRDTVKQEMKQLIRKVVNHDLFTVHGLPETQVTMKALGLSKGFTVLSVDEIERLYEELKGEFGGSEKHIVFKNVFFDTAMMSGTIDGVKFVKKMILRGEMNPSQAQSIFLSLSRSIVTPTTPLLEELYELVTSQKVKELSHDNNLYSSAILGYSTLIEKACLSSNRNTSYPTFVFGKFCHHDSYIVSDKWISYLRKNLREQPRSMISRKNVYIVALGQLNHGSVLTPLIRVLENPEEFTPLQRTLAVYSLAKPGRRHPQRVLAVLSAILSNRAERTEVRVAAFNVIMKLNPDMYYLQKIASMTWVESDLEILKLINSAFYSLSKATAMEDVKPESAVLIRKIRLLYPLIRKTGGTFPTTASVYLNDYLKRLNVGFEKVTSWTASKDSPLPTDFYNKLSYFFDNYRYTPLEYGLHLRGTGSLIEEILEIISGKENTVQSGDESDRFEQEITNKMTGEWRKIMQQLNIEPQRDTDRPEGSLYVNIFETSPIFKSFARESSQSLKHKVKALLQNPGSMLGGGQVSYQRMLNLAPTVVSIPSDMGLPISIELHMPLVMSLKGSYEPEMSLNGLGVRTKFHSMATVQYAGWVGTVCPFTGDYVVTGIDQHAVLNFPNEFTFSLNRHEQTMKLKMKALSSSGISDSGSSVDVLHYHVRPFTVRQKVYDISPMTLNSNFKVIKGNKYTLPKEMHDPREITYDFLKPTGLGLTYSIVSPVPHGQVTPVMLAKYRMYNSNPLNMIRFLFVSTAVSPSKLPSVRMHYIKIRYHPERATTREIDFTLKFGAASRLSKSEPIKYHTLEHKLESGKVLPLGIKSQPIGEASKHPERQRKIKEIMESVDIESGYGLSFTLVSEFKGSRPSRTSWTVRAGFGKAAEFKSKWNVKLESDSESKFCFRGDVDVPLTSTYDIHKMLSEDNRFRFDTSLGFGSGCEKTIKVVGHARTSERQKESARNSQAFHDLQKLIEKNVPLIKLSKVAEKVRRQVSFLDEVDFDIRYSNLPYKYVYLGERFVDYLQLYYFPYVKYNWGYDNSDESYSTSHYLSKLGSSLFGGRKQHGDFYGEQDEDLKKDHPLSKIYRAIVSNEQEYGSTLSEGRSGEIKYKIHIQPKTKTFSLVIVRSGRDAIEIERVPIPFPLAWYYCTTYGCTPMYSTVSKSVIGDVVSYSPVCKVEGRYLNTYDNQTIDLSRMHDSWHLLSAVRARDPTWSVMLGKNEAVPGYKNVKILIKDVPILMKPESRDKMELKVRGVTISLRRGHSRDIHDDTNAVIGTVYKANDETLTFKSTWLDVKSNGEVVEVFPSMMYKSKLCGLCGNYNGDKSDEMVSPRKCLVSKPEVFVASYSIPRNGGSVTSSISDPEIREKLIKETEEKCIKVHSSSGISSSLRRSSVVNKETGVDSGSSYDSRSDLEIEQSLGWGNRCYRRSHHIFHRPGKTCISNMPFEACKSECKEVEEKTKEVSFHCMRSDSSRTKQFVDRVYRGDIIPELMMMSRDVEREIQVPVVCKPVSVF